MTEPQDHTYEDLFERAVAEAPVELSAAGQERRVAMCAELMGEVVARRRARQLRRGAVGALALAAAVLVVTTLWRWSPSGGSAPRENADPMVAWVASPQPPSYEVVATDDSILARYVVASKPVAADVLIGDDELLGLLAGADRPTGLIRSGGRVILTAEVVDPLSE